MLSKYRFIFFLFISLALFTSFAVGALFYFNRFKTESKQVQHTYEVFSQTHQISNLLHIAFQESALVSEGVVYFQILRALDTLYDLVSDNPLQSQKVDSLRIALSTAAKAHRVSEEELNSWQLLLREIENEENQLLFLRDRSYQHISRQLVFYTLIAGICFFAFVLIGLWQLKREDTRRREAEQEAISNGERYRKLIEGARVVVFTTDLNGKFTFISKRVQQLTGYRPEELLGRSYKLLVHPDWHERVTQFFLHQFENKIADTALDFPIVTKEGKEKWIRMFATLLFEEDNPAGLQCVVLDTSERREMLLRLRQAEKQRRENQHLLEALMENISSLVFVKDLEHRYRFVNRAFKETLNLSDNIFGKTDFDIAAPELATRYHASDDRIYQGASIDKSEEVIYVNGEPHHFLITKFPLKDGQQRIFGLCGIATDITDLMQYQEQLYEAKQRAEDAEHFQEQFLTTVSHEMRTPLQGIVGMTYLLSSSSLTAEQQEYLRSIQEAVDTLLTLINDLLDLSKIKAGKLEIEKLPFSLREILQSVDHLFHFRAAEKKLSFSIQVTDQVPDHLIGDAHRLKQILVNLVGNAMKFTETGFIRIQVNALPADTDHRVMLQFTVADSGIGIPSERIHEIFESFKQADTTITRKYGGSGLGLTITQHLVKIQGGNIEVQSEPGKGSVFTVTLPYEIAEQPADYPLPETTLPYISLQGIKVLVAEDNYVNQRFISRLLQRAGADVDIVGNGHEVIHRLRENPHYNILLIDMRMPVMDGHQTILLIRNELKLRMPIIAMTAAILDEEKEKALQSGANVCIRKPFIPKDILHLFQQLLSQHTADQVSSTPSQQQNHLSKKGYDLSAIRELEDDGYMLEVIDLFLKSAPETMQQIQEAYQQQDLERVREKAHRLKSSLGLLGMNELLDLVKQIEMQAKEKNTEGLWQRIQKAQGLLQQMITYLQQEADQLRAQKSMRST
ncbi:MAG: PAS domain S-box protein [Thermoflavifilum sp.]|nr:PAS domain S-box protein [Thermoflavifilum sp.]